MVDRITKDQRSKNMSAIRARGNKTTEQRLLALFKENRVKGWRRHNKNILGIPDFTFHKEKIVLFVDGCFWHGCKCKIRPVSNIEFWKNKIETNKSRDRKINSELRKCNWKVVRIWEHELKKRPQKIVEKIIRILNE